MRFQAGGKEFRRSTGKTEAEIARSQAWQIYLHESGAGQGQAPAPLRSTSPRLGELIDLYRERITDNTTIAPNTIQTNVNSLLRVVKTVYPPPAKEPREQRADVLTQDLIVKYRQRRRVAAGLDPVNGKLRQNT